MSSVSVSEIRKKFGVVEAVKDVSFEVYPGEIFGLLGPNGAGKTTTIRMMMDIFRPDGGQIRILGGKLDEAKKSRIGYLPEERGLYKDLRLEQTLVFLATLKGLRESDARSRLSVWLKRLDLYEHRTKKVQELSKGMQQKAQLIATLVHKPDLLIVDEPFSGLDPINTQMIKDLLVEEKKRGVTIVMSTHQMQQVEELCDRLVLINRGQVVLYGSLADIRHQFAADAVLVRTDGVLPEHIPGVAIQERLNGIVKLKLEENASPQNILRWLVAENVPLEQFEIAVPTLDEIFIRVVQGEVEPA